MTVQEQGRLHRRYADLSHRFRAGWTFHQFLQSLGKANLEPALEDRWSGEFQDLYAALKEVSESLHASDTEPIRQKLDGIDRRLTDVLQALAQEDTRVAPESLRQFFRRIKSYDDKILTQLSKFYLYTHIGGSWPADRLDKVDFILARLSEEEDPGGETVLGDYGRLQEIFRGLWAALAAPEPAAESLREPRAAVDAVRAEVLRAETLDGLNEAGLVRRFREIKHGLGDLYFHPELLLAIQETNLALKARIQKLYGHEERRIVAEYQRVLELESEVPMDLELEGDLAAFREEIERFEGKLQREEFKLEDLAQIRRRVKSLLPRLTAAHRPSGVLRAAGGPDSGEHFLAASAEAAGASLSQNEEILGDYFRRVVESLREVDQEMSPERVVLRPELYPLRLEAREVTAYRRLFGRDEHDAELERFLLEAAALRVRINEEAQEITGAMDETSVTFEAPLYQRSRRTCSLADDYFHRFGRFLNDTLLAGDAAEAQQIQTLRMRLMRDYSGLWLLAYKPFFTRRPGGTYA
jgi:hypothetical protein